MRSWRAVTVAWLGVGLLTACAGGGTDVPDGFQVVEHPRGSVAVPDDWQPAADAAGLEADDPEAVRYQLPDAPEGLPAGVTVLVPPSAAEDSEAAAVLYSRPILTAGGGEQTRREAVEVSGAEEATLLEVEAEASALGGDVVRGTYVSALAGDGTNLVVELLGPRELLTDDLVERIVATIEVDGG